MKNKIDVSWNSLLLILPPVKLRSILQEMDETDREWLRTQENQMALILYIAYLEARKGGKRKTYDEHSFEINVFDNIRIMVKNLKERTYRPSRSAAHIIFSPVIREIFAAPFRDRVVHHLLFMAVYEWWDRHFIYDSYSCRKGKGVLFGIRRLEHHIHSVEQKYGRVPYVYKFDIQGYFMSLPREKLYRTAIRGLNMQFEGREDTPLYYLLKFLWRQIIFDDPVKGATRKGKISNWKLIPTSKSLFCQPKGRGIVIGNLTSQLLSNIYLDQLDRFVTMSLGYKHYGRYVDDFYIVVDKSQLEQLKRDVKVIENFLRSIELTLHPKKRHLIRVDQGVPFLGVVVYLHYTVPGKRLIRNMNQAFREVAMGKRELSTVASYLGHTLHINGFISVKKAFENAGWEYRNDKLFERR